jgi:F-type H+-transporting ATPase subunit gamma
MAGGQERILRQRIRSINATKKITRAFELIAASRIVRAQQRVHAAQPYSDQITEVVKDLAAAGGEVQSPLLNARPEIRRACHVVIAADRGLSGAYNSSVIRAAEGEIKNDALRNVGYSLVLVGRKAESYYRFRGFDIDAVFTGFTETPSYEDARRIGQTVVDLYLAGEVDSVELVYTRFVSAGFQEVVLRPLVPLEHELLQGGDAKPSGTADRRLRVRAVAGESWRRCCPGTSRPASTPPSSTPPPPSGRPPAGMKAATDSAEGSSSYTRVMNRARQDTITTEIMEIVGGAEALSGGKKPETAHHSLEILEAHGVSAS